MGRSRGENGNVEAETGRSRREPRALGGRAARGRGEQPRLAGYREQLQDTGVELWHLHCAPRKV